jgi:hypothetical protein
VEVAKPVLTELILTLLSSEAVEARGVVLGWRLLTDPCSPIYAPQGRSVDLDRLCHESLPVLFALRPLTGITVARAFSDECSEALMLVAGSRSQRGRH